MPTMSLMELMGGDEPKPAKRPTLRAQFEQLRGGFKELQTHPVILPGQVVMEKDYFRSTKPDAGMVLHIYICALDENNVRHRQLRDDWLQHWSFNPNGLDCILAFLGDENRWHYRPHTTCELRPLNDEELAEVFAKDEEEQAA